jgi:hypothetical protein
MTSMHPQPPRSTAQRKADVLAKLRTDVDLWVASADEAGNLLITPQSIQAWREANELEGRQLMREGEWLA